MAKKVNQKVLIFTKNYTNKIIGQEIKCDVAMASHLINLGVAELQKENQIVIEKPILKKKSKK